MVKITLDEESIDAMVKYAKTHRNEVRELMKIFGEEALSVLTEKEVLKEGAKLYREIQREINYTYRKD
ncbi:MAG: hypothetical protein U9R21_02750 [Candidatus Thermoplasmatota archaeon]|nr:hypothetical protein [Candidatus Thermoplasmatota archaeon]